VTTAVWRCEPRPHGRNKASSPLPGRSPSVAVPHRSASPASRPCGYSASFRRRASSFVRCVWSQRRCFLRRREAGGRGACGSQCGVRARGAVLWLRPMRQCVGAQWGRNAKHDDMAMSHGDIMTFLFSEPELFLSEPSRGVFCEQPAGRRAKSRGACSSQRPAAGTVASCRRRRALAAPEDVSRRIVTSLTKSCFPGRRRF